MVANPNVYIQSMVSLLITSVSHTKLIKVGNINNFLLITNLLLYVYISEQAEFSKYLKITSLYVGNSARLTHIYLIPQIL